MKPETDTQDVTLLIEQARRHRNAAVGGSLAGRGWRLAGRILVRADALLHRLLMSPVPNTHILKEN